MNPKISKELVIHRLEQAKEDLKASDYDDEFVVKPEATNVQIETAEELIELVEKYIENSPK